MAACFPSGCSYDVSSQPGHVCIRNQYTASQCCGKCLCIRVRLCLSPALVSLLSRSFHLADGLICFVVFGLFCFVVCFALVGLPWSVTGSCPSAAIVFESIAPLTSSIVGHLTCLAYVPHRPVFHLSCVDSVSPVSPVSLAAKGFAWLWCFWCFWFVLFVFFGLVCLFACLFSVVCFLIPFASLHALALSLTGAQRTDSSSASKKRFHSCGVTTFAPTAARDQRQVVTSSSFRPPWLSASPPGICDQMFGKQNRLF